MVATSQQRPGGETSFGRDIVLNALDLRRRRAREVMQPRPEIVPFDTDASIAECVELAEETRYSRFPLCLHGNLDQPVGVVHIKDLFAHQSRAQTAADLRTVARPLIYVPETARLERVLQFLLGRRLHLALVVDEYGGIVGLLTLENILEELVGQIQDEFDQEKPEIVQEKGNVYRVSGTMLVVDLEDALAVELSERDEDTVGGVVLSELGRPPKNGDTVEVGEVRFEVLDSGRRRINTLLVTVTPQKPR
jgi:CBS domain containing-hemolysin-like protein